MLGKIFESEVSNKQKYYKIVQINKEYKDGKKFPIDELVIADKKIDLSATELINIGGFCISTYEYVFRWLIRGDTLCEVIIPDDSKIYKTVNDSGAYVTERMILTNPRKIDDNLAMELYQNSNLTENAYFRAMTACAIQGYTNTALKVCDDKVDKNNVDVAIKEFEGFCKRREEEYLIKTLENENVKILYDKLKIIKESTTRH